MTGDKSVTAHFTADVYILLVSVDPVGGGSVGVDPVPPYYYGDVVTLTASASPGFSFDHWSGDASGVDPVTSVVMDANKSITAHFIENQYTLTVIIDGHGTVVKDPDQTTYPYNTVVQLTAVADSNWVFSSWGGDLNGTQNPQSITMDGNKTITAYFILNGDDTEPPVIQIQRPTNDGFYIFNQFILPFKMLGMPIVVQMITIEANASDNQTGIEQVEFFVDGISIGTDTSSPYSCDWREIRCGQHTITATATDNAGNTATTPELVVFKWRFHPALIALIFVLGLIWKNEKPNAAQTE